MYCPKCGTKNPENNKFCGQCGAPLISATPTDEVVKAHVEIENVSVLTLILGLLTGLTIVALGFVVLMLIGYGASVIWLLTPAPYIIVLVIAFFARLVALNLLANKIVLPSQLTKLMAVWVIVPIVGLAIVYGYNKTVGPNLKEKEVRQLVKLEKLVLLDGPRLVRLQAKDLAEQVVKHHLDLDNPSSWPKTDHFKASRRGLEVWADTVGELESLEGISRLKRLYYQTPGIYYIGVPQLEALEGYFRLPENSGKSGREILEEYLRTQIKTKEHPDRENYTEEDIKMLFAFVERGPNLKQVLNEYNKHLGNNAPEIP